MPIHAHFPASLITFYTTLSHGVDMVHICVVRRNAFLTLLGFKVQFYILVTAISLCASLRQQTEPVVNLDVRVLLHFALCDVIDKWRISVGVRVIPIFVSILGVGAERL